MQAINKQTKGNHMLIKIRDKKTGKIVAEIPIYFQGIDYLPTQEQYFDEAWRCALEDKSVVFERRSEYEFFNYEG
jgi:hypothetical protein